MFVSWRRGSHLRDLQLRCEFRRSRYNGLFVAESAFSYGADKKILTVLYGFAVTSVHLDVYFDAVIDSYGERIIPDTRFLNWERMNDQTSGRL